MERHGGRSRQNRLVGNALRGVPLVPLSWRRKTAMRIAQVSTVGTPVRRDGSDSIESLVWLLTRELTHLGHEVAVFAAAGSEVEGELVATLPGPYGTNGSPDDWQLCEWINLCRAMAESERFDLLHSHAYLWGLPLQALSRAPMLHT